MAADYGEERKRRKCALFENTDVYLKVLMRAARYALLVFLIPCLLGLEGEVAWQGSNPLPLCIQNVV